MKKILALLTLSFFLFSCEKETVEDLFDKSPEQRVQEEIIQLKKELQSSEHGWKVVYFPDEAIFGGFTYLFKFVNDEKVQMLSDFGISDPDKTSMYEITVTSKTKLAFTSYNFIHEISDGGISSPGFLGEGYNGEFELLYYGVKGGDIIFKTNKNNREFILKKASHEDWKFLSSEENQKIKNTFKGSGQIIYNNTILNYDGSRRFVKGVTNKGYSSRISYTSNGVMFSPGINFKGKEFTKFILNNEGNKLISEDNSLSLLLNLTPIDISQKWTINTDDPNNVSYLFGLYINHIKNLNKKRYNAELSSEIIFGRVTVNKNYDALGIKFMSHLDDQGKYKYPAQAIFDFSGDYRDPSLLNISTLKPGFNYKYFRHLDEFTIDLIINNSPYRVEYENNDKTEVKLTSTKNSNVWFNIKR